MTDRSAITAGQQMVASCSGALITSLLVTPLDVVKVRLQGQKHISVAGGTSSNISLPHCRPMTPLDVVKIRIQAQQKLLRQGGCFIFCNGLMDHICSVNCAICGNGTRNGLATAAANTVAKEWYARPGHFNGTLDAFRQIIRNEGIASLWSGLPPTLVMAVPATVVYFTTYDQLKYFMGYKEEDSQTKYIPIVAGASARVAAATLVNPLELIRTKMQSEKLSYKQVGQAIQVAMKETGPLSLMRGLGPTLLRDVPFSAFYWFAYEYMKAIDLKLSGNSELPFMQSFLAGAVSGTAAAIITLPFDVVKTHRQMELGVVVPNKDKQVSSTWKIISKLYEGNGIKSLFAGLLPRVLKVAPACAVMISSYEYGKSFFRHYNKTAMAESTTRPSRTHTHERLDNDKHNTAEAT